MPMRLTLRTLLAYLDNTLEPQDAERLRQKLAESGFATQLVQRIRDVLADPALPAPQPHAVGPVADANLISEYLDSTLTSEQVAEIERACLESDPHLAEAAACHQILTLVLGQPASVPPALRERIYNLPIAEASKMLDGRDFASLSFDSDRDLDGFTGENTQPFSEPLAVGQQPADAVPTRDDSTPIQPVGVNDSGVTGAPTRLRESGVIGDPTSPAATIGSRRIDESDLYGGTVRTSRITPWLVSLALAAGLLFALSRVFNPLLDQQVVQNDSQPVDVVEIVENIPMEPPSGDGLPADDLVSDPSSSDQNLPNQTMAAETPSTRETESFTPPIAVVSIPDPESDSGSDAAEDVSPSAPPVMADASSANASSPAPQNLVPEDPAPEDLAPEDLAPEDLAPEDLAPEESSDSPPSSSPPAPETAQSPIEMDASDASDASKSSVEAMPVASLLTENVLVLTQTADDWKRLAANDVVTADAAVTCGPSFRAVLKSDLGFELTLIGPARAAIGPGPRGPELTLEHGRLLIGGRSATQPLTVHAAETTIDLSLADAGSLAAVSLDVSREPGVDPLGVGASQTRLDVISVQGSVGVTLSAADSAAETGPLFADPVAASEDETVRVQTGERWSWDRQRPPMLSAVQEIPDWIDPPAVSATSLEASAREGLLMLVEGSDDMELSLIEAAHFRRAEVASLAARTLLAIDRPDIYFGADGIFSDPAQRTYWGEHYEAINEVVNRSPESAAMVYDAAANMDLAASAEIGRLLNGYSQTQLERGGDEELVAMLDSPSMAVRVLALANLEKITGVTLYFRPDQENAIRRAPGIKKWTARQRRGDIRYNQ